MNLHNDLENFGEILGAAATWSGSTEAVNNALDEKENYVYEFYCYLRILAALSETHEIELVPGKNDNRNTFPKAPANKVNYPYFLLKDQKTKKPVAQICAGVKVKTRLEGENHHPDISFQRPFASSEPTWEDLILIMDAKFNTSAERLPNSTFREFCTLVRWFNLQKIPTHDINFPIGIIAIEGNCLLTNAEAHKDKTEAWADSNVKEIEMFIPDRTFVVKS
jgi:hypothetical protein